MSPAAEEHQLHALTAQFDSAQHQVYVDHLTAAVNQADVRNIALTGRYGAGKSSVLKEFTRTHRRRVLVLAMSTLGPAGPDDSETNQIEKELVKQLLHREPPARLPLSRYKRISRPSRGATFATSAVQVALVAAVLALLGLLPDVAGASPSHKWQLRVASATALFALATTLLGWIRLSIANTWISSLSAGGASISLTEKENADSYFDKYLDEIVYFFESVDVDIVVFEDLDRFDNPQIFEALRELNELLNSTQQMGERTIRFVYALKDSIFERLGRETDQDSGETGGDPSGDEAARANRTKFFDMVVPIVPFITHRSSRDLLTRLVNDDASVPAVGPDLIDLTAKHIVDMRLLTNIRNEYVVFHRRLIADEAGVPGLRPDTLFAMLVYKNVHLADFEKVLLGTSALDRLYSHSRRLISHATAVRRDRIRTISQSVALRRSLESKSADHGNRLRWHIDRVFSSRSSRSDYKLVSVSTAGTEFDDNGLQSGEFWKLLLAERTDVVATFGASYNQQRDSITVSFEDVCTLMRDDLDAASWTSREQDDLDQELASLNADLDVLRHADFVDLARRPDFALTVDDVAMSFDRLLVATIRSAVGRELVRKGFIDQNFTLYVSQYYGDSVSISAMNFIVQHVQPNKPDLIYDFADPQDVPSLLRETNGTFLNEDSGYNVAVMNHLLAVGDDRAAAVFARATRLRRPLDAEFLNTYLNTGTHKKQAAQSLATFWPGTFTHLVDGPDVDRAVRTELVDAALRSTNHAIRYRLGRPVRTFLHNNYADLPSMTAPLDPSTMDNVVGLLAASGFECPDLAPVDPTMRQQLVSGRLYALNANNVRLALGRPGAISLDTIAEGTVRDYCLAHPVPYLAAVDDDPATGGLIEHQDSFVDVLNAIASWPTDQVVTALADVPPSWEVSDVGEVAPELWPVLARCERFTASVRNVGLYVERFGAIDDDLGSLLETAETFAASPDQDSSQGPMSHDDLAVAVLQARDVIDDAESRVVLAGSLDLDDYVDVELIDPRAADLLVPLLEYAVCADSAETFAHFAPYDATTLVAAISHSSKFAEFISPDLVAPHVDAVLSSDAVSPDVHHRVLERFDDFLDGATPPAFAAAGRRAMAADIALPAMQIARVATETKDADLTFDLLDRAGDSVPINDVITIASTLGSSYDALSTPGATIELPLRRPQRNVLGRLHNEGHVELVVVTDPPVLRVQVLA